MALTVCAPVRLIDEDAAPPLPALANPLPPPPPPKVVLVPVSELACVAFESVKVRFDVAAPAFPPAPPELDPPAPPDAVCPRVSVPPAAEPLTALVSVLFAPAPPSAPVSPRPPAPPVGATLASAE